ncbi:Cyclin-dependent kinase E-1 [Chlorella vulgaris]
MAASCAGKRVDSVLSRQLARRGQVRPVLGTASPAEFPPLFRAFSSLDKPLWAVGARHQGWAQRVMPPSSHMPSIAACVALIVIASTVQGRSLQQDPATFQGNDTGLFSIVGNTCYVAYVSLGSIVCDDVNTCWQACNDIAEPALCNYYCWCKSPDGCTSNTNSAVMPSGTCLLSTSTDAASARRRRSLAQNQGPGGESIQSVQVLTGPEVPFMAGYRQDLEVEEPSLASDSPLSPLFGIPQSRPAPAPGPQDFVGKSGRRLQAIESFEQRYYRGTEVLQRSPASSTEECNDRCRTESRCAYFAWCPSSQQGGCLLIDATNDTTSTLGPHPWPDLLSGVTFEGGKWLPDATKLVVTNATLGLPGESVSCSEYQGLGKGWQLDESQQYGAPQPYSEPGYGKSLAEQSNSRQPAENAAEFFDSVSSGEGSAEFAALRAAGLATLSGCEDCGSVLLTAAYDSFQYLDSQDEAAVRDYAEAFVKDAQAAGIPACVGVAVTDAPALDVAMRHTAAVLLATALLLAHCAEASGATTLSMRPLQQPFRRRKALETASGPTCGTQAASRFNIPQMLGFGEAPADSAADLARADAAVDLAVLFVDLYTSTDSNGRQRLSSAVVSIKSSVTLSKPLALASRVTLNLGAGAELRLSAQPHFPDTAVVSGAGRLRFVPGQVDEFYVQPDLDAASAACKDVRCVVVLAGSVYRLSRPWRIGPNIRIWSGAATMLKPAGSNRDGIIVGSGTWDPARSLSLPRLWEFAGVAVKVEDVTGLRMYIPNSVLNGIGVLLAPRRVIRNTSIQAPTHSQDKNVWTIAPTAAGAQLIDVDLRAHFFIKPMGGGPTIMAHFTGAFTPRLTNVTIWNMLQFPNLDGSTQSKTPFYLLKNSSPAAVNGLNYKAPSFNGKFPAGWSAISGWFTNLNANIKLTKYYYGSMEMLGKGNVVDWGGFNRLAVSPQDKQYHVMQLKSTPASGTPGRRSLLTANSELVSVPVRQIQSWPNGALKTFYLYHVLATGETDSTTMSLGPFNYARMPTSLRPVNPGLIVSSVRDQGKQVKFEVAVTLKNVAGRALTSADWQGWEWQDGVRFRFVIAALQILVTVTPVTMAREKKMPKLAAALIRGGQSAPQQQPVNQQKAAPPSQPQQGSTGPAASGGAGVPPLLLQKGYDVLGVIGEGTFGRVYLARHGSYPGRFLALKHMKPLLKEYEGVCATGLREVMLLKALQHPNIISLISMHMHVQDLSLCLAFPYAETDLYEVIKYHRERGSAMLHHVFKSAMYQLLAGVAYLHENWVLHRDLKPSNILLEQGRLKIADFGLARSVRQPLEPLWNNGVVVTIWYRAPELLLDARHYTGAIDVWAVGCIMGELMQLRPLFQGEERKGSQDVFQDSQLHKIFAALGQPETQSPWPDVIHMRHWRDDTGGCRQRNPEHGSLNLKQHLWENSPLLRSFPKPDPVLDLLLSMLSLDPGTRITAAKALQHEWFRQEPLPSPDSVFAGQHGRQAPAYPQRAMRPY